VEGESLRNTVADDDDEPMLSLRPVAGSIPGSSEDGDEDVVRIGDGDEFIKSARDVIINDDLLTVVRIKGITSIGAAHVHSLSSKLLIEPIRFASVRRTDDADMPLSHIRWHVRRLLNS
jgi:hypothetical protein